MKILDWLMWIMFFISLVISVITILVLFGISYNSAFKYFSTLLPLEVSLASTFFLWGLNSLYSSYMERKKNSFKYSLLLFVLGGALLVFVVLGVY